MTPTELNKILQELIDLAEDALINGIRKHQNKVVREVIKLLNRSRKGLILSDLGNVITAGRDGTTNRKLVVEIKAALDKLVNSKFIRENIDKYIESYVEIEGYLSNFYAQDNSQYKRRSVQEIATAAKQRVLEALTNGLNSHMKAPLTEILDLAIGGEQLDEIEERMEREAKTHVEDKKRKTVVKTRGHFERFVNNEFLANGPNSRVRDSLHGFSGAVQQAVTQQLGLEWVHYAGGDVADTREFCEKHSGGYYHISEMHKLIKTKWQGKNPSINESNMLILRGGYNCRHAWILVPVSRVPKKWVDRAVKKGYYSRP